MLFEQRLRDGIANGSITVTFRSWRRPQVVAGRRYRTGIGRIEVDKVGIVEPARISAADARRAGYRDLPSLHADLRLVDGVPLYRIAFHRVDEPDPRDLLAHDDCLDGTALADLTRRLARMDAPEPWTAAVLRAIAERPGTRAADLAADLGYAELMAFKTRVRRLKALGLTISLLVGYRLSPRGEALLRALAPDR